MVFFLCFGVVSRLLGLVMVVGSVYNYGDDGCVFWGLSLSVKFRIFDSRICFVALVRLWESLGGEI